MVSPINSKVSTNEVTISPPGPTETICTCPICPPYRSGPITEGFADMALGASGTDSESVTIVGALVSPIGT